MSTSGIVIIGRNEGERLGFCLRSTVRLQVPAIYVDSASTDGSPGLARNLGLEVLELDSAQPMSAGRARNEGVESLMKSHSSLEFIQFLDGDTALEDQWCEHGARILSESPDVCAVFGRLRERFPERSLYNRLAEMDWGATVGEVTAFGGICMVRVQALVKAGGFDPTVIAGEEPELSQRLRADGWKILSLDRAMGVHDAAIMSFWQWMRRSMRTGHAYAQVHALGSRLEHRSGGRAIMRILSWAFLLPVMTLVSALVHPFFPVVLLACLLIQILRIARNRKKQGTERFLAFCYALIWYPSLLAQFVGLSRFHLNRLGGMLPRLIEHKILPAPAAEPSRDESAQLCRKEEDDEPGGGDA